MKKLIPIAHNVACLLEGMYNHKANYELEYKPSWLPCIPSNDILDKFGDPIKKCYRGLTDGHLDLTDRLAMKKKGGQQSFDIWYKEPYNFAIEFDEEQHFNQFRKLTLNHYDTIQVGFNIDDYKGYCTKIKKPSTARFTKLKSADCLFPEFLVGQKQDNRIRQRAFRDMLKDVVPLAIGYNKTIRIPYYTTENRTKDFRAVDLESLEKYLLKYQLLEKLK